MQVKAIRITETGGPEVMSVGTVTLPKPQGTQVLVRNQAIGVNFIDTYHRSGLYPLDLPSGLGSEAAGVVETVGDGVTRVKPGDRVVYVSGGLGSYAEARVVDEQFLIRLPDSISPEMAAGMMLKGLTAAYLLLKTYPVHSGDWILTHAAAGGVGSILTQWANKLGANIIGTVGRPEKVDLAEQQGCHHVLLYREIDVPAKVKELTDGRGVDVVYDSVGKDTFQMSLDSLKRRGMLVSFGNASGAVPDFSPLLLAKKGSLYITRPTLFDYIVDPNEQQELADALFEQVISGNLEAKVNYQFPLAEAVTAHKTLESGSTTGSIILIP